jgi:translation initiation factor IF-2
MRSKRMLLGATVASCLAAAMLSGVHAQQGTDKNNQSNVNGSTQAQQHGGMNNRSNSGAAGDQSATGQSGGANQTARTNQTSRTNQTARTNQTVGTNRNRVRAASKSREGNAVTNEARDVATRGASRAEHYQNRYWRAHGLPSRTAALTVA